MRANTRRQSEVLAVIVEHIDKHGYRPSYAEIARQLGLHSRAGIGRIVSELESQGLVTRRREDGHFYLDIGENKSETSAGVIEIEWLEIPADGEPLEPWQNRPIVLPEFILGGHPHEHFRAYRVSDDAMADEGIHEDDIALVELRQFVRDGECVVAVLNRKNAVLRKYYRSGPDIELRPAGNREDLIRFPADRIEIVALHRGLLRPAM
jgi:repressor LexA